MRLLLDTHIAYWLTLEPDKVSAGERRLLEGATGSLAFSTVSIWEMRIKWNSHHPSGARKGPVGLDAVLAALRGAGCNELPLTGDDAAAGLDVPFPHKDPFDELLLVQAQRHGLRLLTRDPKLAAHPLAITG